MLIHKAYRYRIYPTPEQSARLRAWEDALRFLWNLAHEQRLDGLCRSSGTRKFYTSFAQMLELTELRSVLPWLADVPRNVCDHLLVRLDQAWQRCFKLLAQKPKFKRKNSCRSIGLCEPHPKTWNLKNRALHFPKLGTIRAVVHRPLDGRPKTCTVTRDGNQWFAAIVCEIEIGEPVRRQDSVVALDRGVANLVADSDGLFVESPRFFARAMKRLVRAQRSVSRRKKGSQNRAKAWSRVAKIHQEVARQREHVIHNLSHAYAKSHSTVVVEKLQIRSMVRASKRLAREILDSGWGRLAYCLRYKLAWSGGQLVEVPAAYSSQTCHACGHVCKANRASQMLFMCVECGMIAHADTNAAKVLKSRANRSVLPVEGSVPKAALRSRKRLNVPRRSSENQAHTRPG